MFSWSVTLNGAYLDIKIRLPMAIADVLAKELRRVVVALDEARPGGRAHRNLEDAGTEPRFAEHKAKLAEMARQIAPQIASIPNDQRRSAIKRIAAEHGVTAEILKFILARHSKAVKDKAREDRVRFRASEFRKLRKAGKTQEQIAEVLGTSTRQLRNDLRAHRELTSRRRRELQEHRERFLKARGDI